MYRDHRKGPGGPPGGATYPGGPHGLKWRGNQPLVGWCTPPKGPRRLGLETLGGRCPPRGRRPGGRRPPSRWDIQGGMRHLAPIYSGGEGGQPHPSPWRLPPSRDTSSSPLALGEALPGSCYFHHHAVVLLDLHQPLLPLLDQEGGDVSPNRTCVERGGVVRLALGHR